MVRHWIPNPGVPGLKHWIAPMSTQSLILPGSIKWMPGAPGNWMVKSKMSPRSGTVGLRPLNLIDEKEAINSFLTETL